MHPWGQSETTKPGLSSVLQNGVQRWIQRKRYCTEWLVGKCCDYGDPEASYHIVCCTSFAISDGHTHIDQVRPRHNHQTWANVPQRLLKNGAHCFGEMCCLVQAITQHSKHWSETEGTPELASHTKGRVNSMNLTHRIQIIIAPFPTYDIKSLKVPKVPVVYWYISKVTVNIPSLCNPKSNQMEPNVTITQSSFLLHSPKLAAMIKVQVEVVGHKEAFIIGTLQQSK